MSSRRLLVVDSDPEFHEVLHGILNRDDRTIQDIYDPKEAVARLRDGTCDLVVAGSNNNGSDGVKLLRRVRSIQPNARVIVTGDQDPAHVLGAIRNHAFSYFHKPVAASHFAEVVQIALEANTWKDDIRVVSARPEWITLDVHCKLDAAERTTHFLREMQCDLPQNIREDVSSAFRELLMNAIEHGAKSNPRKKARASVIRTSRSIIGYIHDPGTGFSLDFLPNAAISNPDGSPTRHVEFREQQGQRPGGFGILMTRQLVDDLVYNERGNAVIFVKYFK